ncbi:MAG: CRISPR-associated endonuclease Cas1 [Oscillibacter sp.]
MLARYPLHTLSGIVSFAYPGRLPALMEACARRGGPLAFCTPRGQIPGPGLAARPTGNVLLRRDAVPLTRTTPAQSCRAARIHGVREGVQRPLEHRAHPAGSRPARGRTNGWPPCPPSSRGFCPRWRRRRTWTASGAGGGGRHRLFPAYLTS